MSSTHDSNRQLQRDARLLGTLTNSKYTAARRALEAPFAHGILGEGFDVTQLQRTLEAMAGDPQLALLNESGLEPSVTFPPYIRDLSGFSVEQFMAAVEVLRLLGPATGKNAFSYELKHTVERFLAITDHRQPVGYTSNGLLIFAALYLELPVTPIPGDRNAFIGVDTTQLGYLQAFKPNSNALAADSPYKPAGLTHLVTQMRRIGAGERPISRTFTPRRQDLPFHDWLLSLNLPDSSEADFLDDYRYATTTLFTQAPTLSPDHLIGTLYERGASDRTLAAARTISNRWQGSDPASRPSSALAAAGPFIETVTTLHFTRSAGSSMVDPPRELEYHINETISNLEDGPVPVEYYMQDHDTAILVGLRFTHADPQAVEDAARHIVQAALDRVTSDSHGQVTGRRIGMSMSGM